MIIIARPIQFWYQETESCTMLRYVGDLWDDQKDHDLTRRKRFIQVAKLLALLTLVLGQPSTIPKLTSSKRYHVKLGIKTWR